MEHDGKMMGITPSPAMVRAKESGRSCADMMGPDFMKMIAVQSRTIQQHIEKVPVEGGSVETNENGNTVIRFGENHFNMKNMVIIADKHGNQILGQEKPDKEKNIVNMNGNMYNSVGELGTYVLCVFFCVVRLGIFNLNFKAQKQCLFGLHTIVFEF